MSVIEPLFKTLNDAGIRYVVVGGLAVVLHGYARMTVDVDLFVDHPIPFEELWARSDRFELSQTTVRVASIPDLIELKRRAGRPQDSADIEQLLKATLAATPAQRLAWLEEMLELAHRAGALGNRLDALRS